MVRNLRTEGIPASVSNTAGTFVCNHVFYALMHHLAQATTKDGRPQACRRVEDHPCACAARVGCAPPGYAKHGFGHAGARVAGGHRNSIVRGRTMCAKWAALCTESLPAPRAFEQVLSQSSALVACGYLG
jgi:hypothetical protein